MTEPEKKRTQIYLIDTNCDGNDIFELLFAHAEMQKKESGIDYKVLFTPSLIWEINGRAIGRRTVIHPSDHSAHRHIKDQSKSRKSASRKQLLQQYSDHIIVAPPTEEEQEVLGDINRLAGIHKELLKRNGGDDGGPNSRARQLKSQFRQEMTEEIQNRSRNFADRAIKEWLHGNIDTFIDDTIDFTIITADQPLANGLMSISRNSDDDYSDDHDMDSQTSEKTFEAGYNLGEENTKMDRPSHHVDFYDARAFAQHVWSDVKALHGDREDLDIDKPALMKKAEKILKRKNGNCHLNHQHESALNLACNKREALLAERRQSGFEDAEIQR